MTSSLSSGKSLSSLRWISLSALLLTIAGCDSQASSSGSATPASGVLNYPINVVCTTAQVADLARNIGGDRVSVQALMGPSVDPHQHRATLGDTRKIKAADIVFYNGLHLEGTMSESLEDLKKTQRVVAVTDGILKHAKDRLRKPAEFEGGYDPHVWFDVALWTLCAQEVADQLAALDPAHQSEYQERAQKYITELKELDAECRTALATIPKEQRVLITAHDAFGYFGQAYDVEVHGLQGISTVDEASLATVRALVNLLVNRKIKAVFVESSVSDQSVRNLVDECQRQGHAVQLVKEPLFSDAMGIEGSAEATYPGMIRYNLRVIVDALK